MSIVADFKAFILRTNVLDLAVGVALGTGVGKVVNSIVADIFTPLAGLPTRLDLTSLVIHIHHASFSIGDVLNNLIGFVLLALIIFLVVVKPFTYLQEHAIKSTPTTKECSECLSQIPLAAKRCFACTSVVA